MIVVFFPQPYNKNKYSLFYLDKERGLVTAHSLYPNAVNAIWLPLLMSTVLRTIHEKKIVKQLFLHHYFLNYVGELAVSKSSICLESKFVS
jgi:hypothetical protein